MSLLRCFLLVSLSVLTGFYGPGEHLRIESNPKRVDAGNISGGLMISELDERLSWKSG